LGGSQTIQGDSNLIADNIKKGVSIFNITGSYEQQIFAAISVIYPEGATLTCTNGTKTLTAKNTSGQWVFAIPETGTWTVTAIESGKPLSETVEITTEGQSVNVDLDRLWLYKDGDECTSVTGGWSGYTSYFATVSFYEKNMNMNGANGFPAGISTSNAIDLSKYSTLYIVWEIRNGQNGGPSVAKIGTTAAQITGENPAFTAVKDSPSLGYKTTKCNISSINSGHISMYSQYSFDIDIFQVWLE
jgi:hypothetical protein